MMRTTVGVARALSAAVLAMLVGCDDKPAAKAVDASAAPPPPSTTPTALRSSAPSASGAAETAPDSGEARRYDPKHKCPTGMTHFYMEGDFCRKKCATNADCGKRERCSPMEYPFVMNGLPAGMSRFCEGT